MLHILPLERKTPLVLECKPTDTVGRRVGANSPVEAKLAGESQIAFASNRAVCPGHVRVISIQQPVRTPVARIQVDYLSKQSPVESPARIIVSDVEHLASCSLSGHSDVLRPNRAVNGETVLKGSACYG